VDTLDPATDRHFKTGHHGRGVRDGSGISHSFHCSQIGLHFDAPAPRATHEPDPVADLLDVQVGDAGIEVFFEARDRGGMRATRSMM
jgi:hypothetical protein